MPEPHDVVRDYRGQELLHCSRCGRALSHAELYELGLRLPDAGESREEYCDAEVLDSVRHQACISMPAAG